MERSKSLPHASSSARTLQPYTSSRRSSGASVASAMTSGMVTKVGDSTGDVVADNGVRNGGRSFVKSASQGFDNRSLRRSSLDRTNGNGSGEKEVSVAKSSSTGFDRGSLRRPSLKENNGNGERGPNGEGVEYGRRKSLTPVQESREPPAPTSSRGSAAAATTATTSPLSTAQTSTQQPCTPEASANTALQCYEIPAIHITEIPITPVAAADTELQKRRMDELTTLVAFGVIIPSLTPEGGAGLPLSATPAYQNRFLVPSSCPQPEPGSPTLATPSASMPRRKRAESFGGRMQRDYMPKTPSPPQTLDDSALDLNSQASMFRRRSSVPSEAQSTILTPAEALRPAHSLTSADTNHPLPDFAFMTSPPSKSHSSSIPTSALIPSAADGAPAPAAPHVAGVAREYPAFEQRLRKLMAPKVFLKDEMIIRKNDVGREMYFLVKGRVEVLSGDLQRCYNVIDKGSFFGELGVLYDIPRTASVRASQNCYCMILCRADLSTVLKDFPLIATRFRKVVQARMREVQAKRRTKSRLEFVPAPGIGMVEEEDCQEEECDSEDEEDLKGSLDGVDVQQ
ncbi:Kinesin-like protein kif27 [Rhizophlyctis rosea]|nr:Kinesin-like protein kif27 [Rhizophlyctis rosea]